MARRHRKRKLPQDPVQVTIDSLSHDGRGIARIEGKTIFIAGALAGETVQFVYTKKHSKYDEGRTVEVLTSSEDRVEPACPHFAICGGCSVMHMSSSAQLILKQKTLAEHLLHFGQLEPEQWLPPLTGPVLAYRRKARLGVRYVHKKQRVLVGFREKASPFLAVLEQCAVLDQRVGARLAELGEMIAGLEAYDRIAQIEVAMDEEHVALVFRNLVPLTQADQDALIHYGQQTGLWIYLQSGGPETVEPLWPSNPQLRYSPEPGIELDFNPNDFTQVNSAINQSMVQKAIELLDLSEHDRVLDLFCGLGNFSLPIARRVHEVIGVEGDAALVQHAQHNALKNNMQNADFEQADLTKTELRDYSWASSGFNKILLDPPRSGALEVLHQLVDLGAERIVYVSCNPATLARDAGELVNNHGYRLVSTGVMDMFPHTSHVESIALFVKS